MKLLFLCSTAWELKTVKSQIKNLKLKEKVQFDYLNTWIGNYNVIFNLTNYLNGKNKFFANAQNDSHSEQSEESKKFNEKYDFIINIWVCWFKKNWELKIENWKIKDDFIQVWRIFNLTTKKEIDCLVNALKEICHEWIHFSSLWRNDIKKEELQRVS